MASLAGTALVGAETIMALTPIAIKKTPLDPISALFSRTLSSAALGYLLTGPSGLPSIQELAGSGALGATNLIHISSSYEAFRHLPAGQAMSLLYTYPLWNLIFMSFFGGEKISIFSYGFIGLATVGAFLLNMDPGVASPTALVKSANPSWGILMGLVMALSESTMVVLLKLIGWRDPAKSVFIVNSSASIWLAGILFIQEIVGSTANLFGTPPAAGKWQGTWWDTAILTLFHSVTLFSGYWLRYYAVPRLSTVTYAMLSYAGLIASYVFGIFFVKEMPGLISIAGAALIIISGLFLQIYKVPGSEDNHKE
jgi:drug/metabolite transporter (DMT)-like permease